MLKTISSKKAATVAVIVVTLILVFSVFVPTVFSQTSNTNTTIPVTVNTYGAAWDGEIAFDLSNPSVLNATVVMDTNGDVINMRQSATSYDGATYNIAPDTILFEGEPGTTIPDTVWTACATHLWNFVTNTTVDYPNVLSEHDIQYDPVNNTFLTLQDYVRQIGNNSVLCDKMVEVDANGNVLWTWDTYNYIPLSEMSPFNETADLKGTTIPVEDFTHANDIVWDYNNSIIYLNIRNTNTFYKIDQDTGDIIWACGEFGNFTLLDQNGNQVPSLWYHSHDTKMVAPDVFTMFDNDYDNNTNPDNCHSQLLELTLNETSMTAQVTWSWTAPTQYWNSYGGSTVILPNGDFLGCFGDPTHQLTQNKPWDFNNTGAVIVEVNPVGQVVKTWTFPVGWFIYRVDAVTDVATTSTPTPTPTSTPDSTVTPTLTPTSTLTATTTPTMNPTTDQQFGSSEMTAIAAAAIITIGIVIAAALYFRKQNKKMKKEEEALPPSS